MAHSNSPNSKTTRIGFIGECMIELKQNVSGIQQHFSGDVLNTAVFFQRQLTSSNIEAQFISAIGKDRFSRAMLEFWQREGLDCDHVLQVDNKLPGLYFIQVDERGERSFNYWRNDSAAKVMFSQVGSRQLLDHISTLDGVYLSGITLAILTPNDRERLFDALAQLKRNQGKIYFDNNFRPALWLDKLGFEKQGPDNLQFDNKRPKMEHAVAAYDRIMTQCDMAFLTADDEAALYGTKTIGEIFNRIESFEIPEVVIKCGADPACIQVGKDRLTVSAEKVSTVVDTTAAGDSFSAAYLAARLQGQTPQQSAQAGHKLAAQVIQTEGVFS